MWALGLHSNEAPARVRQPQEEGGGGCRIEVKIACGYRGSLRPCVVDW